MPNQPFNPSNTAAQPVVTRTRAIGGPWSGWRWRSHPAGDDSPLEYPTASAAVAAARIAMARGQPVTKQLPEPANPQLGASDGTRRPRMVDRRKVEPYSTD